MPTNIYAVSSDCYFGFGSKFINLNNFNTYIMMIGLVNSENAIIVWDPILYQFFGGWDSGWHHPSASSPHIV